MESRDLQNWMHFEAMNLLTMVGRVAPRAPSWRGRTLAMVKAGVGQNQFWEASLRWLAGAARAERRALL